MTPEELRRAARRFMKLREPDASFGGGEVGPGAQDVVEQTGENPLIGLMQNYQAYLRKSGNKVEPLLDPMPMRGKTFDSVGAGKVIPTAAGDAFSINRTGNKRAGQTFQTIELPGGQIAHVYYGPGGERTVVRLPRRRTGPAKGIVR